MNDFNFTPDNIRSVSFRVLSGPAIPGTYDDPGEPAYEIQDLYSIELPLDLEVEIGEKYVWEYPDGDAQMIASYTVDRVFTYGGIQIIGVTGTLERSFPAPSLNDIGRG